MAGDPLRKVISREVDGLENHPDAKGHGNVTDVMIVIRFEDNHFHCRIPQIPVTQQMVNHLTDVIRREVKDQRIIVPGMKWIE